MRRKLLSVLLVFIMVLSLTAPAFAAGPVITASYNKKSETVTIKVDDVTEVFTGIGNNTTKAYTVNGWEVNVTAKNDVATINSKKQVAKPEAVTEAPKTVEVSAAYSKGAKTLTIKVGDVTETIVGVSNNTTKSYIVGGWEVNITAKNDAATINYKTEVAVVVADDGAVVAPELRIVEVQQSWSKTTFHCNTFGGNGRVWPQVGPYSKKSDGHITVVLEEIPGTTYWKLIDVKDTLTGESYGVPTCPGKHQFCGSCEWISYSNNSGVPNGKNIQLHHDMPGDDEGGFEGSISLVKKVNGIEITKYNYDGEGTIKDLITGFELYTTTGDGGEKGDFVSFAPLDVYGSIAFSDLADGWYVVEELLTAEGEEYFETPDLFYVQIVNGAQIGGLKTDTTYNPEGPYYSSTLAERSAMAILADDGTIISPTSDATINTWLAEQFASDGNVVTYSNLMSYDVTVNDLAAFYARPNGSVSEGGFIPGGIELTAEQEKLIVAALDWVYVTYGSFETLDTIPYNIAQALIWRIVGTIELNDSYNISKIVAFNESTLSNESTLTIEPDFINSVLAGCLEAYAAREAEGVLRVVGLLSLQSDFISSQCLLVPYFGEATGGGFNNKTKVVYSDLTLKKTVDGTGIEIADANYEGEGSIFDLIVGFDLYKTTGRGEAKGAYVASAKLDDLGGILFEHLEDGWYVVEEILTAEGEEYFEIPELFYVQIVDGAQVNGGTSEYYLVSGDVNFGGVIVSKNAYHDYPTIGDAWYSNFKNSVYLPEMKEIALKAGVTEFDWVWERNYDYRGADKDYLRGATWEQNFEFTPLNCITDANLYFAADDAVVVKVNDDYYYSETQLTDNGGGNFTFNYPLGSYQHKVSEGEGFEAYYFDITASLTPGAVNSITIIGMNQDDSAPGSDGTYDGNPAGMLFALEVISETTFDNKTKTDYENSSLSFEKKVEGMNISEWLAEYFDEVEIMEVLEGLEFSLVGANGSYGPVTPDIFGMVAFEKIASGTYTLSEEVTGAAIGVFKKMADVELEIAEGDNKVFVLGGTVNGNIEETRFNDDDLFKIIPGYISGYGQRLLGYTGLNGTGEFFYIGVTNTVTGEAYTSFCAHGGSKRFAGDFANSTCSGYMVVERAEIAGLANPEMDAQFESILAALNWIHTNVGDLRIGYDSTIPYGWTTTARVIAQTTIWALLGNIDVNSQTFANTRLSAEEKALVYAALDAAEAGYAGDIVDLVYMVCNKHHAFDDCQPQLVPIFGTFYVENEVEEEFEYNGAMQVSFEVEASRDVVTYRYDRIYDTKTGSITADAKGSTTHNWFGMTTLNVEAVKENPVVLSQLRYGNGANDLYDFGYTISIDEDGFIWIDFGALEVGAYIELMSLSGGKGIFNSNGDHPTYTGLINTGLNVGDVDEVYLYVHLDSVTYFTGEYARVEDSRTSEEVDYTDELTLVITDEDGNVVYSVTGKLSELEDYIFNTIAIPGPFQIGTYTATLSGYGFDTLSDTQELKEEVTLITFDFGTISVTYPDFEIDPGQPA